MVLSFMPAFSLPVFAITAQEPLEGDGTADNPYKIASAQNLAWFRDKVNGSNGLTAQTDACAVLTTDINLNNEDWTAIANSKRYTGTFDGRNHTISNLKISSSGWYYGFFRYAGNGTVIKNLHIEGTVSGGCSVGPFVGELRGGTIKNCSFDGSVSGSQRMSGLVGVVYEAASTIEDCYVNGSVSSSIDTPAGFCSENTAKLTLTRCHSNVSVYGPTYVGGLVSVQSTTLNAEDCLITKPVTAGSYAGMWTGLHTAGTLKVNRCHYYASPYLGHIGKDDAANLATITNSYWLRDSTSGNGLSATDFRNPSKFNGWDIPDSSVWKMGTDYPILQQRVDLESETKRTIYVYDDETKDLNLPDYFNLVMSEDHKYNQDDCFNFTITQNGTKTKQVYDEETYQMVDKTFSLASVDTADTDELILDGSAVGVGEYTITVNAVDNSSERTEHPYDTFDIPLTVVVKKAIPEPRVLTEEFAYSRGMTLDSVFLTDGWEWSDPSICPKDRNTEGYEAVYMFDSDEEYYDYSAVQAAAEDETNTTVLSYDKIYEELEEGSTEEPKVIGIKAMLKVPVVRSSESPWDASFIVVDADNGNPIDGASVSCDYADEFPYAKTTDANGKIEADMSAGDHKLIISANGYQTKTETVTIVASDTLNDEITLELVPERYEFTTPKVLLRGTTTEVENAQVNITRLNTDKAKAWNNNANSLVANANDTVELPDGDYKITPATYGYTTDDVTFVRINRDAMVEGEEYDEDPRELYYQTSDFDVATTKELGSVLYVLKMSEPMYYVNIRKIDEGTYTADVKLSNIKATYGTFGIRYNPELFELNPAFTKDDPDGGVILGDEIQGDFTQTVEEMYGQTWDNSNGYFTFLWSVNDDDETFIDTEPTTHGSNAKTIVTFKFKLKGSDEGDYSLADRFTIDTFGIKPWDETAAAKSYASLLKTANPNADPMFWEYWRYLDSDNKKRNLKKGRIEESKSVVNGSDTGGFFQAAVNGSLGDNDPASFYDVMTVLHYDFNINNSVIKFHVTDAETGDDLQGARIRLFDTGTKLFGTENTLSNGTATFSVDTSGVAITDFTYDTVLKGYWPVPKSGLLNDKPSVSAETGKVTDVEVSLEKKIYHKAQVVDNASSLTLVEDADLGGEKYAYNGQDYHFRIKGAKGFRIKSYPKFAYVSIGDENAENRVVELELEHDKNGLFTLKAEKIAQHALSRQYMEDTLGYTDVEDQPDDEGFRSYNIVIHFSEYEVIELEYDVEGMTNNLGYVTYAPDEGENDCLMTDHADKDDDGNDEYIVVHTHNSEREGGRNHSTGTFTFKAKGDNVVEKVYINGLLIDTYNGEKEFSYTFGTVDMDSSIIVMFWDGVTPSNDTVMTLVVGEYGSVDVSSPEVDKDVSLTRRVYLNPTANLEFKAKAINEDYTLCSVEKANEGFARIDITQSADDDGKYSIPPVTGESVTVYVTFRNVDVDRTPNVFVKSYVYDGKGVINPAGILIYTMHDTPELLLTTDEDDNWRAKGVMISPFEKLNEVNEWDFDSILKSNTYRHESLTGDIAIGAIFVEKAYKLQGIVDLSQRSQVTEADPKTGALVTFKRLENGVEVEKQVPVKATTTAARTGAVFTAELPAGDWNVYITKQGYATYKITNFPFNPDGNEETYKFGVSDGGVQQTVVPYIGAAVSGESITLSDAAAIKSGLRKDVSDSIHTIADVDNDNYVTYKDMTYVMNNFNKWMIIQEYETFRNSGSATEAVPTPTPAP